MNTLPKTNTGGEILERVLLHGDLSQLNSEQKVVYYKQVCESLGLNWKTKPFEYITLNRKEVLYATRACTEQLRQIHKVSLNITARETIGDVYVVTARARTIEREDESTGAVNIKGLMGDNLANAYMKAETKAKRRVTLSICGLAVLDETEAASIPGAKLSSPVLPVNDIKTTEVKTTDFDQTKHLTETSHDDINSRFVTIKNAPTEAQAKDYINDVLAGRITNPGDYVIPIGRLTNAKISDMTRDEAASYLATIKENRGKVSSELLGTVDDVIKHLEAYLSLN